MGNETPAGMAYSEFQQYLKELGQLGILLNVDSKNEMANAEAGFARADSVLKKEDFVCFKANWEPKHLNLAAMAKEINILPESFVFVDDNPAEREIIRRELPGVSVPEMTAPEEYLTTLDRAGYFEVPPCRRTTRSGPVCTSRMPSAPRWSRASAATRII